MATQNGFVGRQAELDQFKKVLEDPKGQAVLVVGQAGMGKTWLVNKMATIAERHPDLKCGCVRYEVTPTDTVDSTMALMMDNAFEAACVTERSFDGTTRRLEQWRSFLNVFNMGDLVMSLRRDPAKNTREQFVERLRLISKRMPEHGRALFIIDPEKYMQEDSDQSWAIVVKELPDKVKCIFAQRPDDVLVGSETFSALKNVVRIPKEDLDVLSDEDVHHLVLAHSSELSCSMGDLENVLRRYKGHPYAVGAAIELAKAGVGLEDLPKRAEPIEFTKKQREKVCDKSEDAIRLFKAYAVLDVGVPDDVVEAVGKLDTDKRQHLLVDKYLSGLLREEGHGKRIYHAILADYVLSQIEETENKEYHARAVEVYRGKLKKAREDKSRPDELAAMRLPEHVMEAEGAAAFVETLVNECTQPLKSLGLLDAAIYLSELARGMVKRGSEEEAVVTGNLGVIYQMRGDLDKAEQMHRKSLEIAGKLGLQEGMASQYGNLGLIYRDRGDLDKAEQMHRKALEIDHRLGRLEGMANQYGNLGSLYEQRGDTAKAREYWGKAVELYKRIGMPQMVKKVEGWLRGTDN